MSNCAKNKEVAYEARWSVPWMNLPYFDIKSNQSVCIIQLIIQIIIIDPYVFDFLAAEFQNILNWG